MINADTDGFFMAVGDPSGDDARNLGSPLGKLHRLVEQDPYAGASLIDNGFFIPDQVGLGIRQPGGASAINGELLLADRGGSVEHELSFFLPDAQPLDFGWPQWEGTEPMASSPQQQIVSPAVVYPFGEGEREGTGVIGGGVYQGPSNELADRYVFGDESGLIWSLPVDQLTNEDLTTSDALENRTADFVPDEGQIDSPTGFAVDDMGRFFILDADGEIFRVDGD